MAWFAPTGRPVNDGMAVASLDRGGVGPSIGPAGVAGNVPEQEGNVLWTIFVILLVLWLLGMVSSYTLGGFIHVLLVIAIVVVLIRLFTGRRPV